MVLLTVTAFTADARFSFFTVSAFLTGSAAPPAAIALISPSVVVYTSAPLSTFPRRFDLHSPSTISLCIMEISASELCSFIKLSATFFKYSLSSAPAHTVNSTFSVFFLLSSAALLFFALSGLPEHPVSILTAINATSIPANIFFS